MCVWEKHCICWDECIWPEAKSWMFSVSLFGCCRFSFTFLIPHVHSPNLFSLILCPNPVSALWLFRVSINTSGTASHKLKLLGAKEMSLDIPSSYSQLEKKKLCSLPLHTIKPPMGWVSVVGCWFGSLLMCIFVDPYSFFPKESQIPMNICSFDPYPQLVIRFICFIGLVNPASQNPTTHWDSTPCHTQEHPSWQNPQAERTQPKIPGSHQDDELDL